MNFHFELRKWLSHIEIDAKWVIYRFIWRYMILHFYILQVFFSKSFSDISRQSDVRSGKCQCQTETDYLRYSMNMTSWWFGCFQLSPVSIVYNQYFLESLSLPNKSIQGATKKIHNFIPQKSLCPALTSQSMIDSQKRVGQKRTV